MSASASAQPGYTHQQIMQVLSGILLCILLAAIDQTVVVPAVPAIARDLHGFGHLSWIVSAYLLTSTATTPIYGKLSDMYGRRALLVPALGLFVAASALCALSQTIFALIAARALQGVGGGGLMALSQAAIADVIAPRERGKYQAYMASMWGIASIAGPILGGYVTMHLTWRWIFWFNLPLGLVALWLSQRGLRRLPVRHGGGRIDYAGAVLLTGAITAFLLLMSWGGIAYPWVSPEILALAAAGTALTVGLMVQENLAGEPLLPPRVFRSKVFRGGVAVAFFAALGLFAGIFLLPLFFQLVRGADPAQSGLEVMPFLGANVVGAYLAGQMARRIGRTKALLICGLGLTMAGFLLLGLFGPRSAMGLVQADLCLLGFGIGMVMPSSLVLVQNDAERRDVGVATGSFLFLRAMGGAFGATLAGAVLIGRFGDLLGALHLPFRLDLGNLDQGRASLGGLSAAQRLAVQGALTDAFHLAFLITGFLTALAVLIALSLEDVPLRGSITSEPEPIGH